MIDRDSSVRTAVRRVIARASEPSPEVTQSAAGAGLPPDLLTQSCRRVGTAALVFAGLWAAVLLINTVGYRLFMDQLPEYARRMWPVPGAIFMGAGVVLSVGMLLVTRRLSDRPLLLLDAGLVFLVLTAAIIGLLNHWMPSPGGSPVGGRAMATVASRVSWICVVILIYPAIAPNTPTKILGAGLIAASMDPLGLGVAVLRGVPLSLTPFEFAWSYLPNYLCAIIAVLPAHIIVRLGRQVRSARELGSYELVSLIGKGGMGEVHRARHRLLARPAAIKLIRPDVLGDSTTREAEVTISRFRREAEAVASLRSPHTIDLYDFGVTDSGAFYFVMELLEGVDLESLIERHGPVPAERAIHLIEQACSSLAEAHARGMIHRDVKPSNIHTCRMGLEVDFVKVLDFGLVKTQRAGGAESALLTAPEVTTGTPAFMAPEAIEEGGTIDARVDIYALGCVLYWLVTGHLVFDAVNPVAMMMKHLHDAPVPPSRRTELPIPPELDALILACIAKRPTDRPADASALAAGLAACPVPRPWDGARAREWWDLHMVAASAGAHRAAARPLARV